MSLKIEVSGYTLDIPSATTTQLVLNAPWYFGGSSKEIAGSYTFPFSVELTPINRKALHLPNLLDSVQELPTSLPATFTLAGISYPCIAGVQRASKLQAQIYVIVDTISALKEVSLTQIDLGGVRQITPSIADQIALNFDNDFVLFPLRGIQADININADWLLRREVNYHANGSFAGIGPMSPFIRVDYLLSQIASHVGYTLINQWQINDELKRLVLANNRALFTDTRGQTDNVWPDDFDLKNHVPDISCSEFLRELCRWANVVPIINSTDRTIRIVPSNNIIHSDVDDWTPYTSQSYEVTTEISRPASIAQANHGLDSDVINTFDYELSLVADIDTLPAGYHKVLITSSQLVYDVRVYQFLNGGSLASGFEVLKVYYYRPEVVVSDNPLDNEKIELKIGAGFQLEGYPTLPTGWLFPGIQRIVNNEPVVIESDASEVIGALYLYRGVRTDPSTNQPTPWASVFATNDTGPDFNYSLNMHGDKGVYQSFHAAWWNLIARRRSIQREFILPSHKFHQFNFDVRIKVGNQLYIVRQLKVNSASSTNVNVTADIVAAF